MQLGPERKQIDKYKEFIEKKYLSLIHHNITKKQYYVNIDFMDIAKYDIDLSQELLESPKEHIDFMEIAIEEIDKGMNGMLVRIINLPDSCKIPIWEIRQDFIKFIKIEGILFKQGDILMRPEQVKYECPACGAITLVQRKNDFEPIIEPTRCGCGRRGQFRKVAEVLRNYQKIFIEEDIMEIGKRQEPKNKLALLLDDLTATHTQQQMLLGKKVILNGWLKTYLKINGNKNTESILDTYVYVNSIQFLEVGWDVIKIPHHIVPKLTQMSKDPQILENLKQSIFPDIHGEDDAKRALVLQAVGASNKYVHGKIIRGTIMIALCGNPGTAKTFMAKNLLKIWPISRFTSSQTSSGRGLIAATVFDKPLEKWVIVPGVIPCCNKGLAICDEFDKMQEEEYGWMNNAMNDLEVFIDKVAHARLDSDTAILATMNPEGRHWNTDDIKYNQISLPGDLLDRFDLIFPLVASDKDEDKDKIIDISMDSFFETDSKLIKPIYDKDTVVYYITMARKIKVKLPEEMKNIVKERIKKFTSNGNNEKTQKMSNRVYSTIYRLMEAHARLHLRDTIIPEDLDYVVSLLITSYKMLGLITESGLFNYESYERIDKKKSNLHTDIKLFLKNKDVVADEDIIKSLPDYPEVEVEEILEKMVRSGEIFEPKRGHRKLI